MRRLDVLLVEQGKIATRSRAQRLIADGKVKVWQASGWETITKASQKFADNTEIEVVDSNPFVSRGGLKLAGALQYSGLSLANKVVIDVGQSTGGFTDCALKAGATKVVGIEVGHGQLVESLKNDCRVVCIEGMNARALPAALLNYTESVQGFDVAVMDVSFISQTIILPVLTPLLKKNGQLLSLVKPQFEVGPGGLGKGGIVKNERLYTEVQKKIEDCCKALNLQVRGYFDSPIKGGDGNREFFIWAERV